MKQRLYYSSIIVLVMATSTCAYAGTISFTDNRVSDETTLDETQFESEGYIYKDSLDCVTYYVTVTNNSDATVTVTGSGIGVDKDGNELASETMSIEVLGAGETGIGYFWFDDTDGIVDVEYSLEYEKQEYYEPVVNDLAVDGVINDSSITLTVTNNGQYNAQFVEAYALFLNEDGAVVSAGSTYITDNDSEIKVGDTISEQLTSYEPFDDVKVYLIGRTDGTSSTVSDFDTSKIEVNEYLFEDDFSTSDYVVITNNSDQTLGITGNATALGNDGAVLGAGNMSIEVLGPGETGIGYYWFDDVKGVEKVNSKLYFDTDPCYKPVIGNLDADVSINSENIVAQVTNSGDYSAMFVEGYAIFFDENNNVVNVGSTYFTDDDCEIKPDATITGQIDSYSQFDHVELYFTGRAD